MGVLFGKFRLSRWFQNLNENKRRWFHFRGSFGSSWEHEWVKYEVASGPSCRLRLCMDEEDGPSFSFGLIFFTVYLHFRWMKIPFLRRGREYGFYWADWTLWMFWGRDPMSSSRNDPWYYEIVWHPLDVLFGRTVHFETERINSLRPVMFEFRGNQYQMDEIKVCSSYWFRSWIPFALYRKEMLRMHLDIKKPPMHSGKGENSWDCDDDGTFGMCAPYTGPKPIWTNSDAVFEWCCRYYCESVSKDIKRYGRASGDAVDRDKIGFKYLGRVKVDGPEAMASAKE